MVHNYTNETEKTGWGGAAWLLWPRETCLRKWHLSWDGAVEEEPGSSRAERRCPWPGDSRGHGPAVGRAPARWEVWNTPLVPLHVTVLRILSRQQNPQSYVFESWGCRDKDLEDSEH